MLSYPLLIFYFCDQDPLLFCLFFCLLWFGDRHFSYLLILILYTFFIACFLTSCLCNYITGLYLPLHSYGYHKPGCVIKCWKLSFPLSSARKKVGNCQHHLKISSSSSIHTSEKLLVICPKKWSVFKFSPFKLFCTLSYPVGGIVFLSPFRRGYFAWFQNTSQTVLVFFMLVTNVSSVSNHAMIILSLYLDNDLCQLTIWITMLSTRVRLILPPCCYFLSTFPSTTSCPIASFFLLNIWSHVFSEY